MNDKSDKVSELYKFSGTIGAPFQRIYFLIFFVTPFTSSIFFLCWSNSVTKLLNYSNCSISVKFEMLQYFSWIFELKLNKEQRLPNQSKHLKGCSKTALQLHQHCSQQTGLQTIQAANNHLFLYQSGYCLLDFPMISLIKEIWREKN